MKHAVLGSYIRLFVNKLGSTHATVHYLDGYAGPGVYADGSHGSPKLAVDVAALVEDIRDLKCTFVEHDKKHAAALAELLSAALPEAKVIRGRLADHIESIALEADVAPLLAFIDPFGLGISFSKLNRLTQRSNKKTDIIMNVSLSALRRIGGQLTSESQDETYLKARTTMIDNMDAVLGGDWWQEIWKRTHAAGEDGAMPIALGYAERCKKLRGGYFIAEVKDRWDGPPAYMLLLLAGHGDAFWNFNEMMSHAHDKLREIDAEGHLFAFEADYKPILRDRILDLISKGSFMVGDNLKAVYGPLLGIARSTHLRDVLKDLCKAGAITTVSKNSKKATVGDGQGDVQHMQVCPVAVG